MKNSSRLRYLSAITQESFNRLWHNCFEGAENLAYMNAYTPAQYAIPNSPAFVFQWMSQVRRVWLIQKLNDNEIIGYVMHADIPGLPNNIGFNIGRAYAGQGYATEALRSLLGFLRNEGYMWVEGHCCHTNHASMQVMQKAGMRNMGETERVFGNCKEIKFRIDFPNVLEELTIEEMQGSGLPLDKILKNSLYYPASGFHGFVIKYCNTKGAYWNIENFVYCDYGVDEEQLQDKWDNFRGYTRIFERDVTRQELIPNGWLPQLPPNFNLREYPTHLNHPANLFIKWMVYERTPEYGAEHGPKRFGLLYLFGEGVATYQALYWTNKQSAKVVAVFDHGWGGNYTEFSDSEGPLKWVLIGNLSGVPTYIYYNHKQLLWNNYVCIEMEERFSIWKNNSER